jgi:NTE family protein
MASTSEPAYRGATTEPTTGIVLSGGGMRGAYEAGVVSGIMRALGRRPSDPSLFQIFTGSSVGAINASFLAANADRGDHGIEDLLDIWRSLRLEEQMRVRPLGLVPLPRKWRKRLSDRLGPEMMRQGLLDSRGLRDLVTSAIDFDRLHTNTRSGVVHALIVTALQVASGRTTMFAELSPKTRFRASHDSRRIPSRGPVGAEHVLASAAIPLLFPTRRIGKHFYCDGSLRFNTPIAPAIRAGANRLVVVTLIHDDRDDETHLSQRVSHGPPREEDPNPVFLAGKLLDALLLDPVDYDLHVLERFNKLAQVLERTLPPEEMKKIDEIMIESRGVPYRNLPTIVFRPSLDLGSVAGDVVEKLQQRDVGPILKKVLKWAMSESGQEADWASFLLFDGLLADRMIELGREDALARTREIQEFFGSDI